MVVAFTKAEKELAKFGLHSTAPVVSKNSITTEISEDQSVADAPRSES